MCIFDNKLFKIKKKTKFQTIKAMKNLFEKNRFAVEFIRIRKNQVKRKKNLL